MGLMNLAGEHSDTRVKALYGHIYGLDHDDFVVCESHISTQKGSMLTLGQSIMGPIHTSHAVRDWQYTPRVCI